MARSGWCLSGAHVGRDLTQQNPCPQGPENDGDCTCDCHPTISKPHIARKPGRGRRVESTPPL